jgi:membrane protein implicated in regulation of membrane protease activity
MVIYFIIALIGVLFLLASALLGEVFDFLGDVDADGDVHPLSGKVIAVALIAFGSAGMLTQYYDFGPALGALTSTIAALFLGAIAWWMFSALQRQTGSTNISTSSMRGRDAEVIVPIGAGAVGQVQISSSSGTRKYIARTADGSAIPAETRVRIIDIAGGVALVERVEERATTTAEPQGVEG